MKKELSVTEKTVWALGQSTTLPTPSTGRQFITALVPIYILVFLTDTFSVPAGAAGVIMTVATIWDAINDPILGSLADRTKTRWGTYRPYLLFATPDLTTSGKIIYAAVLYICYGMLVTCIEIPYNALLPTMTQNKMERNDTVSFSTFISAIMVLIVSSFTPNLVAVLGGKNPSKGYMILVGIAAVVMIMTSWLAFAKCKERHMVEKESQPPAVSLRKLIRVKEMFPMILHWCVCCIRSLWHPLYTIACTT